MDDEGWAAFPGDPEHVDDDAAGGQVLTVDGERFRLVRRAPGTYSYSWLSGPNDGYGFTSGSSTGADSTDAAHVRTIRDFLAAIDPRTGYLGD